MVVICQHYADKSQSRDTEICLIPNFKKFTLTGDTQFVLCDTSITYPIPFILDKLCRSIFDSIYLITHLGIK